MTYRLVPSARVPEDFLENQLDKVFDADHYQLCKLVTDWGEACRGGFTIEQVIEIDDWCPYLTCLEPIPHTHPVCPKCGAVRWGNMFCSECRSHWPAESQRLKQILEASNP